MYTQTLLEARSIRECTRDRQECCFSTFPSVVRGALDDREVAESEILPIDSPVAQSSAFSPSREQQRMERKAEEYGLSSATLMNSRRALTMILKRCSNGIMFVIFIQDYIRDQ
ncbi:hypothetical protein WA026_015900 [Henosepilachna vigintioctopunctata]|uniref:Uncharacterized protein n=1 Tax=Henosepilachna vigintioctopunctata TaxID=420089 RepID=A0AAW1U7G2_9CUCU